MLALENAVQFHRKFRQIPSTWVTIKWYKYYLDYWESGVSQKGKCCVIRIRVSNEIGWCIDKMIGKALIDIDRRWVWVIYQETYNTSDLPDPLELVVWPRQQTRHNHMCNPSPLFTKWTDVLPQDLVKPRSLEIEVDTFPIALIFDRHLGSSAVEIPVKFQNDTIIIASNLAASRLHEIWQ